MKTTINERGDVEVILGEDNPRGITPVFSLCGNYLVLWDKIDSAEHEIPDWLADGIRELVKNKIEQENSRGA